MCMEGHVMCMEGHVMCMEGPVMCMEGHVMCMEGHVMCMEGHVMCMEGHVMCMEGHVMCMEGHVMCMEGHMMCMEGNVMYGRSRSHGLTIFRACLLSNSLMSLFKVDSITCLGSLAGERDTLLVTRPTGSYPPPPQSGALLHLHS